MTREIPSTSDIAAFWGCPFLIVASGVGYGELGLNGDMGYGGACVTNAFGFRWSLSAHADSTVTLLVKDECRVRGFLNGTAANCNGVKFIIDGVLAGRAWRPYDLIAEFHLTPGRHVLETRAMDGNGNCHSVWGFDAPPEAVDLPKHEVAIGAICKNENEYLDEWIRHHVSIGVTHIYLLDNGSTIPLADTIATLGLAGQVTVEQFSTIGSDTQNVAYMHLLRKHGRRCRWMALIDVDEFIIPKISSHLPTVLKAFEEYGALLVRWVMLGSNGLEERPAEQRWAYTDSYVDTHVKGIVQPRFVMGVPNPHMFWLMPGRPATGDQFDGQPSTMHIQLNHYWTRSRTEWHDKIARGALVPGYERSWDDFHRHQARCQYRDTATWALRDAQSQAGKRDRSLPIVGFIHVAAVNHWQSILRSQLAKVVRSGLYDLVDHIWLGIVGAPTSVVDSLHDLPEKVSVAFCQSNLREYEFPTLRFLQNACLQRECFVWYVHTKGVTNGHAGQVGWRNKMEEFVLVHHELALAKLAQGYSVAAAFGCDDERWPVPGNFWWARSEHVASLPDVASLNWSDRWQAERWIVPRYPGELYVHDDGDTVFNWLRVLDHKAGAGRLTTNGWHSWIREPVRMDRQWHADLILSSHAPSRIRVEVRDAIAVFGFTCASGRANGWRVEFRIDGSSCGEVIEVGQRTTSMQVSPGSHLLEIVLLEGDKWGAHTGWAVTREHD